MFMLQWIIQNRVRIILNLLVWVFIANAAYHNMRGYTPVAGKEITYYLHIICHNILLLVTASLNTMWLMPKYFIRRKYKAYFASFLVLFICSTVVCSSYSHWLLGYFHGSDQINFSPIAISIKSNGTSWVGYYIQVMPSMFITFFAFAVGFLMQQYFYEKKQHEIIRKKQMESELSLLKSQINPHFLFNVLNSIYSLSLKKSDKTPEVVLKLSDILRYMLYETKQEKVALEKELMMIENYIIIEKIRVGQHQSITLEITGDNAPSLIAPVLLIPFVENAVKHGIDSLSENAFIRIAIRVENGTLNFNCQNNYKDKSAKAKPIGGIGLLNVQKRLDLIYPDKHKLEITNENHIFTVSLTIDLNA